MRVVFFGTGSFAVRSLECVASDGQTVVAVVTQPDRPKGRGQRLESSPVKQVALGVGLPVTQPERLTAAVLGDTKMDVGIVADYGQLIRQDVIDRFTHGILGVHPSLLPKYRGAAPVAWTILNGERETGVTIFRASIVEGLPSRGIA